MTMKYILATVSVVFTIAVLVGRRYFLDGIFRKQLSKECMNKDLTGFYAIVTGANRGIGYEIAKFLVQHGCFVVFACRNEKRANQAITNITLQSKLSKSDIKLGTMQFIELSLDNLKSINQFLKTFKSLNIPLHFLIHNAAYQTVKYEFTADKYEKCWQVNYLSPFYITHHLLPVIYDSVRKNPRTFYGRIVSVTSKGHLHCNAIPYYHFNNTDKLFKNKAKVEKIRKEKFNEIEGEYHNTKMGQVLYTIRLQQMLNKQINYHDKNIKIDACCVHPGLVDTDIFQWQEKPYFVQIFIKLLTPIIYLITITTKEAAQCVIHCVLTDRRCPTIASGGYHSNFKTFTPGYGSKQTVKLIATDLNKLYDSTMEVLELQPLQL